MDQHHDNPLDAEDETWAIAHQRATLISKVVQIENASRRADAIRAIAAELAEFFLPGLRELLHEASLLSKLWTEQRPMRLASARTILYAAMANFSAEPGASYSRTVDALVGSRRTAVEQWLRHLPQHSAKILNPQRAHDRGNSPVSHLRQI